MPRRCPPGFSSTPAPGRSNIQPDAVVLLATFVGRNLRQLDNELEKLALYAAGCAVNAQDVRAMVADASEEMIWKLDRRPLPAQRRQGDACPARAVLERSGAHYWSAGAIVRQYRLLIQVKTMMNNGVMAADRIAEAIGEKKSTFPVEKAEAGQDFTALGSGM